jgi:hypothetical protein
VCLAFTQHQKVVRVESRNVGGGTGCSVFPKVRISDLPVVQLGVSLFVYLFSTSEPAVQALDFDGILQVLKQNGLDETTIGLACGLTEDQEKRVVRAYKLGGASGALALVKQFTCTFVIVGFFCSSVLDASCALLYLSDLFCLFAVSVYVMQHLRRKRTIKVLCCSRSFYASAVCVFVACAAVVSSWLDIDRISVIGLSTRRCVFSWNDCWLVWTRWRCQALLLCDCVFVLCGTCICLYRCGRCVACF